MKEVLKLIEQMEKHHKKCFRLEIFSDETGGIYWGKKEIFEFENLKDLDDRLCQFVTETCKKKSYDWS